MKILSGKFRGRNFYMPAEIRPSQNMARKAVFDIIGHDLSGMGFLELFAGSGAVGLEALSLGAQKVTFVEKMPKCVETIEENLRLLGVPSSHERDSPCEVIQGDAFAAIKMFAQQKRSFDIIFIDPPYGRDLAKKALKTLMAYDIVQPDCLIIVQYSAAESLPDVEERFSFIKQKRYGRSLLSIYQYKKS